MEKDKPFEACAGCKNPNCAKQKKCLDPKKQGKKGKPGMYGYDKAKK